MLPGTLVRVVPSNDPLICNFSRTSTKVCSSVKLLLNQENLMAESPDNGRSDRTEPPHAKRNDSGFSNIGTVVSSGFNASRRGFTQDRRAEERFMVTPFPYGQFVIQPFNYQTPNVIPIVRTHPLNYMYFHSQANNEQLQQRAQHTHSSESVHKLRYWEKIYDSKKITAGFKFGVMCYNVLAQKLLTDHRYLYNQHESKHLEWELRWKNILSEIKRFQPTILCLQEVQESHLELYFNKQLNTMGYSGVFKKRTGPRPDGCAIYYKHDVISMIEHATVEYKQPSISILDRDNVGIIAKFSPIKDPSKEFVVATTHLLYNPRREDIKLAQTQLLLTEIDRIAYKPIKNEGQYLPVILTGDLNSTPNTTVYKLITKGEIKYEHSLPRTGKILVPSSLRITDQCQHADLLHMRRDNKLLSRSEEVDLIKIKNSDFKDKKREASDDISASHFGSGTLTHKFSFKSVYRHEVDGDIEGTTFQDEWISVDYIFYSKKENFRKLTLLGRYKLPLSGQLGNIKVPDGHSGSDHLPLLAKFHLK